jgi:hypothetical protein
LEFIVVNIFGYKFLDLKQLALILLNYQFGIPTMMETLHLVTGLLIVLVDGHLQQLNSILEQQLYVEMELTLIIILENIYY